jgi:Flp pilus assembly protein TadG
LKRSAINADRGEAGQAVILVVVAMSIFLIAALGLAVDGGEMYAQRQMAQAAADAAAQAGIMSIYDGTNSTSPYPFGTGSTPIASSVCTTTDLRTPCVYARYNGFGGTTADTVTLSYPATVSGVTLSSATVPAFAVTVQRTLQTGLIRFVPGGPATSSITAKATAGLVGTVSPDCLYVLDPSAPSAFQASGGVSVTASGCAISVNSSSSTAASVTGGASVSATAIDVVGGVAVNNGGTTTPTPVTGVTPIADPFVSLPALTPGTCLHATTYSPPSWTTLVPGTYCGGINVGNGATNVTFGAGNYIINGGGITFGGGTTSSGSGVMFYLTGTNASYGSVTIANGVDVTLSAPTSGTYLGVLFFQNRLINSSSNADFAGGATMLLTGSLYFPTTDVAFSNGSSAEANSTAIVADKISFTGGANIKYDSTGLKTGLFSKAVALVQ